MLIFTSATNFFNLCQNQAKITFMFLFNFNIIFSFEKYIFLFDDLLLGQN